MWNRLGLPLYRMLLYHRYPGNSPHGEKYSSTPTVAKRAPKPKLAAASSSIPVADGQLCSSSGLCAMVRGSFTVSLFSIRGRRIADEWVQCIVSFAYLHHVHDTISMYACQHVCMSACMHVSVYARAFGNTAAQRSASLILCRTHSGIHAHHMHTWMHAHMAVPSRFLVLI